MTMDTMVNEVLSICPDVSQRDIKRDLFLTGSTEVTINRIFDGNFLIGVEETTPSFYLSGRVSDTDAKDHEGFNDDDDLPFVSLTTENQGNHHISKDDSGKPTCSNNHDIILIREDDVSHKKSVCRTELNQNHENSSHPADKSDFSCLANNLRSCSNHPTQGKNSVTEIFSVEDDECHSSSTDSYTLAPSTPEREVNDSREVTSTAESEVNFLAKYSYEPNKKITLIDVDRKEVTPEKSHLKETNAMAFLHQKHCKNPSPFKRKATAIEISSSDSDSDLEMKMVPLLRRLHHLNGSRDQPTSEASKNSSDEDLSPGHVQPPLSTSSSVSALLSQSSTTASSTSLYLSQSSRVNTDVDSQSSVSSLTSKKAKRSPEEIADAKRKALELKAQRAKEREEKQRQKEAERREKQKEADQRKALREAHKALRPEECMKYLTVVVDPSCLEGPNGAVILAKLQSLTCKLAIESQATPSAITWKRCDAYQKLGEDLQMDTIQKESEENEALVILDVKNFVPMIHSTKQENQGHFSSDPTLRSFCRQTSRDLGEKQLTLLVQGMDQYFRKGKTSSQRNYRSAVLGEDAKQAPKKGKKRKGNFDDLPSITRVDMEEALVELQLSSATNVRLCETAEKLADHVAMFTKAVAEKPFKAERDKATFSFHVNTEWAGGVKVDKDGRGLLRVWRQQLQQFRNVSPEIASAIIAEYPSPQVLLQAYQRCVSVREAQRLLEDIVVRRGEGVLATSRRVGKELSRRVYLQMTTHNENLSL